MKIQFSKLIWLMVIIVLLSGCQKAPAKNVVVSKNDGTFDVTKAISASEANSSELEEVQTITVNDQFFSSDNSVEFHLNLEESIYTNHMPVVAVAPHFLTVEDAKNVAHALFGDEQFYEAEASSDPVYSKDEIQRKLLRWAPYGGSDGIAGEFIAGVVDKFIAEYTLLMENAPVENPHKPCEWTFKKETYYFYPSTVAATMDTSGDNDQIQAKVFVEGIPYLCTVSTRNKSDFKLNNIYARLYDGASPASIDQTIFRSQLCQTNKPDESTLAKIKAKAEEILKQMNLGEWKIDECYAEEINNNGDSEYIVYINAVPVFQQVAALRRPQLNNLNSSEVYASNYYLSDVQFQFSANGELIYFEMYSPVDVKEIVNDNVATLSIDELIEKAEDFFTYTDYYEYGFGSAVDVINEKMRCIVNIDNIEYGLTRVKMPDTDEGYYYLPAISFSGRSEYSGVDSGNVYYSGDENRTLLVLNAIDGSVINTANE